MASEFTSPVNPVAESNSVITGYVTAPPDFPQIHITTPANGVGDGYIFASNFIPAAFRGTQIQVPICLSWMIAASRYITKKSRDGCGNRFQRNEQWAVSLLGKRRYHLLDNSYKEG